MSHKSEPTEHRTGPALRRLAGALFLTLVATMTIPAEGALAAPDDLSGEWAGDVSCRVFETDGVHKSTHAVTLSIEQSETVLGVALETGTSQLDHEIDLCGIVTAKSTTNTAIALGIMGPLDTGGLRLGSSQDRAAKT